MGVMALPSPIWIDEPDGESHYLDVELVKGPGLLDVTLHLTHIDGDKLGTLVINKLHLGLA